MTAHRCVAWSATGAALGLAIVAHAQDPLTQLATDPSGVQVFTDLLSGGGLPAVLALLGWLAGRWGGVPVVLRMSDEDRRLLKRFLPKDDDDSDNPSPRT
jgi:hypothetical protein